MSPLSGIVAVSAGDLHTCALTMAGGVLCWGDNKAGQLGNGSADGSPVPVAVSGLTSGVAGVSAGWQHTCALTAIGGVKCWGDGEAGQLGNNMGGLWSTVPVAVSGLSSGVAAVATGWDYSCALTTAGGVQCWGALLDGNPMLVSFVPVAASGLSSGVAAISANQNYICALTTAGGVPCWGENPDPPGSGPSSGVVAIAAGGRDHACAVTTAGGVLCWGYNDYGQLGDGTQTSVNQAPVAVSGLSSGIVAISAGLGHTCALTTAGGVLCWGYNVYGQLGNDSTIDSNVPVAVSGLSSGVAAISAGALHTCAVTMAGGVVCWGSSFDGELGDGTAMERHTPVQVLGP